MTITANTDAGGSIIFTPADGLNITPTTPDALNVILTTNGVNIVDVSSIAGTINYSGGVITASDGTWARVLHQGSWESEMHTEGGASSLRYDAEKTVYTASEGATLILDYLDGSTFEIQHGTFAEIYAAEDADFAYIVSAGTAYKSNDLDDVGVDFLLDGAGEYELNGIKVTTKADRVTFQTGGDYETIMMSADAAVEPAAEAGFQQMDLFTDYGPSEAEKERERKERRMRRLSCRRRLATSRFRSTKTKAAE